MDVGGSGVQGGVWVGGAVGGGAYVGTGGVGLPGVSVGWGVSLGGAGVRLLAASKTGGWGRASIRRRHPGPPDSVEAAG